MPTVAPIDPDDLSLEGISRGALRDLPVVVLGFARSGVALARFLVDAGATVTVYDARPAAELGTALADLAGRPVRIQAGPEVDVRAVLAGAALILTSPSINPDYPTTEPSLRALLRSIVDARAAGDRHAPAIVSEPDLFLRLCPAPVIGVTGTKGKTTTTTLLAALLATDPIHPVVLGGNLGVPIVDRLPELTPAHRVAYELSELQLPTLSRGTTMAVYTNVTADHLDRHGSLEAYRRAKRRLAEFVDPDGALVLNADDPVVAGYAGLGGVPAITYRFGPPAPGGLGVVDGWIVASGIRRLALAGGGPTAIDDAGRILPVGELRIPGRHSVANAMAAIGGALAFGIEPPAIRRAAAMFEGVEHRLEPLATIDGVRFVNDSMATQPEAVIAALEAFDGPIVLIAGGRDKGVDLGPLARVVAARAAAAVLIGESAADLERRFREAGLARIERAVDLAAAVVIADALARERLAAGDAPPATVLLSPAAASFDQFVDYADRGRAFRAAVTAVRLDRDEEPHR